VKKNRTNIETFLVNVFNSVVQMHLLFKYKNVQKNKFKRDIDPKFRCRPPFLEALEEGIGALRYQVLHKIVVYRLGRGANTG